MPRPSDPSPRRPIDTGWPLLISAIAILGATVLIPAYRDLAEVRWQRDRAIALERHRFDRILAHERYLASLRSGNPELVESLAATQLGRIPEGHRPLLRTSVVDGDASVFPALEPPPLVLPEFKGTGSVLETLTTNDRSRVWVIAIGATLLLIGLLPPAAPREVGRRATECRETDLDDLDDLDEFDDEPWSDEDA
jgi:hypothetical protein